MPEAPKITGVIPKSLYEKIVEKLIVKLTTKDELKACAEEIKAWLVSENKDAEKLVNILSSLRTNEDY
ncbi:MAG: hypothetical protein PHH13_00850 [Candidatus Peribacteraceae bacterium]|nr:hypothetical protein [Candidatus Peribacteraceae bacterium]